MGHFLLYSMKCFVLLSPLLLSPLPYLSQFPGRLLQGQTTNTLKAESSLPLFTPHFWHVSVSRQGGREENGEESVSQYWIKILFPVQSSIREDLSRQHSLHCSGAAVCNLIRKHYTLSETAYVNGELLRRRERYCRAVVTFCFSSGIEDIYSFAFLLTLFPVPKRRKTVFHFNTPPWISLILDWAEALPRPDFHGGNAAFQDAFLSRKQMWNWAVLND